MLPCTVDLGVIKMKKYSTFPKAPVLELHHQMQFSAISRTLVREWVLLICRDTVGVFNSPNRLYLSEWRLSLIYSRVSTRSLEISFYINSSRNN